jgi:hypothetical protein
MTTPTQLPAQSPSIGDAAQSMKETATDEGRAVVDTARSETQRLASQARTEARKQGDEQARRLGAQLRDVGTQLDGVRRGEAPSGAVATVVDEVASRANQWADRLDTDGIGGVASDVKQFARQRPAIFLLGAFGLGVVAGRTLRNADTHALMQAAKPSEGADLEMSPSYGQSAGGSPEPERYPR